MCFSPTFSETKRKALHFPAPWGLSNPSFVSGPNEFSLSIFCIPTSCTPRSHVAKALSPGLDKWAGRCAAHVDLVLLQEECFYSRAGVCPAFSGVGWNGIGWNGTVELEGSSKNHLLQLPDCGRANQELKHVVEYLHGKATIACWHGHESFPRFWSFRSTPRGFLDTETDIRVRKEGAGHCLHGEEHWDLADTSAVSSAQ